MAVISLLTKPQLEAVLRLTTALAAVSDRAALLASARAAFAPLYPASAGALVVAPAGSTGNAPLGEALAASEPGFLPALAPLLTAFAGYVERAAAPSLFTLTYSPAETGWRLAGEAGGELPAVAAEPFLTANAENLAAAHQAGIRQVRGFALRHGPHYLATLLLAAPAPRPRAAASPAYIGQLVAPVAQALHDLLAREQSEARQRQQELLFALSGQAATVRNAADLFHLLFQKVQPILGFYGAAVILRQSDGQHYRHLATDAGPATRQRPSYAPVGRLSPVAGSPHEAFFSAPQPAPLLLDLADVHQRYPQHWESVLGQELGFRQRFWLPLRLPGRLLGTLEFLSDQAGFFTPRHFPLAQAIADLLAVAVGNLLANEEIEAREREKSWQLAVGTALAGSPDRATLAHALADEINQAVPCHYIELHFGGLGTVWQLSRQADGRFATLPPAVGLAPPPDPAHAAAEAQVPAGVYVGPALDEVLAAIPRFRQFHAQQELWALLKLTLPATRCGEGGYLLLGHRTPYAYAPANAQLLALLLPQLVLALNNLAAFEQIAALSEQLAQDKTYLTEEIQRTHNFEEMVGTSPALHQVMAQVQLVAPTDATVLLHGETGTGKELIARALHHLSPRRARVLVKVNCAALPPQLIESELFGHEKGAFTGALERRVGKFELAHQGTIFLDEIGELPLELQAKLLRVLQGKEFERLGGQATLTADFRVVAATNRDLKQEVAAGRFRADLYYRLSTFPLLLPPLRERPEDILPLATSFAQKFAKQMGRPFRGIAEAAAQALRDYAWPGNIRELENVVEQAVIVCGGAPLRWARPLTAEPPSATKSPAAPATGRRPSPFSDAEKQRIFALLHETKGKVVGPHGAAQQLGVYPSRLREVEYEFLEALLAQAGGRVRGEHGAATRLGVNPTTLEARLKKLGLHRSQAVSEPGSLVAAGFTS